MPDISNTSATSVLWTEKLRPGLHNSANWIKSTDSKLVHVPTGLGFYGQEQMNRFFEQFGACWTLFCKEDVKSISCVIDETSGKVFDEFILEWTQKSSSRIEWMLPGLDIPLQKYRLSFVISAQIDPVSKLLANVRVYWDQASFLLQTGILMRSIKHLLRSNTSDALEDALTKLPIASNEYRQVLFNSFSENKPTIGGGLNSITSILTDLPRSTSGPAVMTPQRPTSSRSLNPALLGSLKLGDSHPFDSPLPANTRNVKSRNIFFEDPEEEESKKTVPRPQASNQMSLFDKMASPDSYRPGLASNTGTLNNSKSHIFNNQDQIQEKYNPSLLINDNFTHQYQSHIFSGSPTKKVPLANLPQTDKILFESHVFDSVQDGDLAGISKENHHVATAPPQCPSHILSPEEDLKCKPETVSSTLSRPGMLGHFRGASLGETDSSSCDAPVKFIPSTAIRFDPNKSQIVLGGYDDNNQDADGKFIPSSRVSAPPGGKSSIFN